MTAAIGLTGGIGSGKSTAALMFAALGVPILDLDVVGQTVTEAGEEGLSRIIERFGESMLHADGTLNRAALAVYCFADSTRTQELNDILHPLIWAYEAKWLRQQKSPYVLIEASVLIESGGFSRMDAVVVVLADFDIRQQRVLQRDGQDEARFNAIVAQQCDDAMRQQMADYLLNNISCQNHLQQQVKSLHQLLLQRFNG